MIPAREQVWAVRSQPSEQCTSTLTPSCTACTQCPHFTARFVPQLDQCTSTGTFGIPFLERSLVQNLPVVVYLKQTLQGNVFKTLPAKMSIFNLSRPHFRLPWCDSCSNRHPGVTPAAIATQVWLMRQSPPRCDCDSCSNRHQNARQSVWDKSLSLQNFSQIHSAVSVTMRPKQQTWYPSITTMKKIITLCVMCKLTVSVSTEHCQDRQTDSSVNIAETLATKTEASMTDFMCLIQPELSSPLRNMDMEGFCSSHTTHHHTTQHIISYTHSRS